MGKLTTMMFALFMLSVNVLCQERNGKVLPSELEVKWHNWTFERTEDGPDDHCAVSWRVTVANNSDYTVKKIKCKLIIIVDGERLYEKKHDLRLDLEPGEVDSCDEFRLKNKVCANVPLSDVYVYPILEIISVN